MVSFLNQGLELSLFVLLVGLAEDQGEHRQGEVVVIIVGFLAGVQGARDDRRSRLAFKGVAGRAGVLADLTGYGLRGRAEVLADGGESLSEVSLLVQRLARIGHEMCLRVAHEY